MESQFGFKLLNQTMQNFQFCSVSFPKHLRANCFPKQNCLIGCLREHQSTSEVQTYSSEVESQYIKLNTDLIITIKSRI